eukprot:3620365-Rhodomonas_salina.1
MPAYPSQHTDLSRLRMADCDIKGKYPPGTMDWDANEDGDHGREHQLSKHLDLNHDVRTAHGRECVCVGDSGRGQYRSANVHSERVGGRVRGSGECTCSQYQYLTLYGRKSPPTASIAFCSRSFW